MDLDRTLPQTILFRVRAKISPLDLIHLFFETFTFFCVRATKTENHENTARQCQDMPKIRISAVLLRKTYAFGPSRSQKLLWKPRYWSRPALCAATWPLREFLGKWLMCRNRNVLDAILSIQQPTTVESQSLSSFTLLTPLGSMWSSALYKMSICVATTAEAREQQANYHIEG